VSEPFSVVINGVLERSPSSSSSSSSSSDGEMEGFFGHFTMGEVRKKNNGNLVIFFLGRAFSLLGVAIIAPKYLR